MWDRGPAGSPAGRPRRGQPAALVIDRSRRRGGTRGGPLPRVGGISRYPPWFSVPRPGRRTKRSNSSPKKYRRGVKPPSFADYRTRQTPRRIAVGSAARKSGVPLFRFGSATSRKSAARKNGVPLFPVRQRDKQEVGRMVRVAPEDLAWATLSVVIPVPGLDPGTQPPLQRAPRAAGWPGQARP
jgi:hypothetical protein